jgi:hypothetical protein
VHSREQTGVGEWLQRWVLRLGVTIPRTTRYSPPCLLEAVSGRGEHRVNRGCVIARRHFPTLVLSRSGAKGLRIAPCLSSCSPSGSKNMCNSIMSIPWAHGNARIAFQWTISIRSPSPYRLVPRSVEDDNDTTHLTISSMPEKRINIYRTNKTTTLILIGKLDSPTELSMGSHIAIGTAYLCLRHIARRSSHIDIYNDDESRSATSAQPPKRRNDSVVSWTCVTVADNSSNCAVCASLAPMLSCMDA